MSTQRTIYFPKTNRIYEDFQKLGAKGAKELYEVPNLDELLNNTFEKEYRSHILNSIFFDGCPLALYSQKYKERLSAYIQMFPDADEFDFLKEELAIIQTLQFNWEMAFPFYKFLASRPHRLNLNLSNEKVRDFIFKKNEVLGHYVVPPYGIDEFDFFYSGRPVDYWIVGLKRNEEIQKIPEIPDGIKSKKESAKTPLNNFTIGSKAAKILFTVFERNKIINDVDNSAGNLTAEQFESVLISDWGDNVPQKIKIQIETNVFAILIEELSTINAFKNLTFKNIGSSGIFISGRNKPITYDNLRSAKSYISKKQPALYSTKLTSMKAVVDSIKKLPLA